MDVFLVWFSNLFFHTDFTSQALRKFQNIPFMHMEPASFYPFRLHYT